MAAVTVNELFKIHAERLKLSWIAGRTGGIRNINSAEVHTETRKIVGDDLSTLETWWNASGEDLMPRKSLVGHLNLIHPNQVQVLGYFEVEYLAGLREISREDAIRQLLSHDPDCLIVAEAQKVPEELRQACEMEGTPLFSSSLSSNQLVDDLHYYLSNLLAEVVTLHGVYMEIMSIGVLLTGESGVGKSELALELITRGHRLIADDAPEFSRIAPDIINGTCPKALIDFLEVRGLGILNVRELFGAGALRGNKYLRLIIRLERMDHESVVRLNRLEGSYRTRKIVGIDIPEILIPVAPGRNLAVLVECAARNHILRMSGYNSTDDFMERQRALMAQETR
jgi:HPr kinase/phosphorylase